jgi:hypothetical protein
MPRNPDATGAGRPGGASDPASIAIPRRGQQADADRDQHTADDRPLFMAAHRRATDRSYTLAEKKNPDADQKKTKAADYAADDHAVYILLDEIGSRAQTPRSGLPQSRSSGGGLAITRTENRDLTRLSPTSPLAGPVGDIQSRPAAGESDPSSAQSGIDRHERTGDAR